MTKTPEQQAATAQEAIGAALEGMAAFAVTDDVATRETMKLAVTLALAKPMAIDADDVVKLALVLIGAHRGGPQGIVTWCEETAAAIRNDPDAPLPVTIN